MKGSVLCAAISARAPSNKGCKVHISEASVADEVLVLPTRALRPEDKDYAVNQMRSYWPSAPTNPPALSKELTHRLFVMPGR